MFSKTFLKRTVWLYSYYKKTNSLWLSWERNPKDTLIFGFMFVIGMQKDINSLLSAFQDCKIPCHFRYYSRRLNTQKKDRSFALRKGKSSDWFAPGRKMQRYYQSLEVLCFARCHFCARYQRAPGYSKACKKDQVLLPCPVDKLFCWFFSNRDFFFFFSLSLLLRGDLKKISEHTGISNISWCNLWSKGLFSDPDGS